jgi:23S rRNA (uridine2552-2'-O)-methyltransferase
MIETWRKKQAKDYYYTKAKSSGYRARSAYKLLEIQAKFNLIKPNSSVLDIGCAPGGWLQVVKSICNGKVIGIDLQEVNPIPGVTLIKGDFMDNEFVRSNIGPIKFDVVLSDLSPNISGDRETDHFESVELTRAVHEFSTSSLKDGGSMVCKLFDGADTKYLLEDIKKNMSVKIFKPKSSRPESREMYLVCIKKGSS